MRKLILIFALFCGRLWAAGPYYVDPLYTSGGSNGTSTNPWTSLSSGWATINTGLASGPVTVYFSATVSDTTAINLGSRTDASTNVLTLDGTSQKNTNETTPAWVTNATPVPCTQLGATSNTCVWNTAAKYTIQAANPITGNDTFSNCLGYFTVQGFHFKTTEGSADLTYLHDLTFQYNEVERVALGSYGPGVIAGTGSFGPCHTGAARPGGTDSGPDNVTVQYNYIHATWGECIYVPGSTGDPWSNTVRPDRQQTEATNLNLQCGGQSSTAACPTGANYILKGNSLESCASWGGQGDGVDIKDGHVNLTVTQHTIRITKSCASCGSQSPGVDGQGILAESGTLFDGNYIEAPGRQCLPIYSSWNNSTGRGTATIRNNVCLNANGGGSNVAWHWFAPTANVNAWIGFNLYNNTAYNSDAFCISIDSGGAGNGTNPAASANVENNICHSTSVGGILADVGIINVRDYNDFFLAGTCPGEAHGICTDPLFVSTNTPYVATNFNLQVTSPALYVGLALSPAFADYFGNNRPSGIWDIGFYQYGAIPPAPALGMFARLEK